MVSYAFLSCRNGLNVVCFHRDQQKIQIQKGIQKTHIKKTYQFKNLTFTCNSIF